MVSNGYQPKTSKPIKYSSPPSGGAVAQREEEPATDIRIQKADKNYESCEDCIHEGDSDTTCILRHCIHAVTELKECYEEKTPKQKKKKGRWIPQDHNKRYGGFSTCVYYFPKCSICGMAGSERYLFCPHCGADMRGEQE